MDEILKCNHSNEKHRVEVSCGAVYYAVHGGSMDEILKNGVIIQTKNSSTSTFLWCCTRWVLSFESVDKILKCKHSNESY